MIPHWMPAATLAEILAKLPPGAEVVPNDVKNLAVLSHDGIYLGFINFCEGRWGYVE